jgi:hypothetical protein
MTEGHFFNYSSQLEKSIPSARSPRSKNTRREGTNQSDRNLRTATASYLHRRPLIAPMDN